MKNDMLLGILIALAIVILIVQLFTLFELRPGIAPSPQGSTSYLSVSAEGMAMARPTQATLDINVQGRGQNAYAATANLTTALTRANATLLKYTNGNTSLIQTSYYNLYNQSSYYYTSYNGYVAQESLTVTIPNVNNVSVVLGALSAVNGISINGVTAGFSSSETASLRSSALGNALANATAQAKALLPNKTLTVSNITVNAYGPIVFPLASGAVSSSSPGAVSPAFFTGTQTVTESITVVFSYNRNQ